MSAPGMSEPAERPPARCTRRTSSPTVPQPARRRVRRRRRAAGPRAGPRAALAAAGRARCGRAIALVVIGFLLAVAYQQTVAASRTRSQARAGLVDEVQPTGRPRPTSCRATRRPARRGGAGSETRRWPGRRQLPRLARPGGAAPGSAAVTRRRRRGPVADAPAAVDPVTGSRRPERPGPGARPRPAGLANALWPAGAEAIAINGQRLTADHDDPRRRRARSWSTSGRSTGPYEMSAIGPDDLDKRFADSADRQRYKRIGRPYRHAVRHRGQGRAHPAGGAGPAAALRDRRPVHRRRPDRSAAARSGDARPSPSGGRPMIAVSR